MPKRGMQTGGASAPCVPLGAPQLPSPTVAPEEKVAWVPPEEPPEDCDTSKEKYAALTAHLQKPGNLPPQTKSDEALAAAGYHSWLHYVWFQLCMYLD